MLGPGAGNECSEGPAGASGRRAWGVQVGRAPWVQKCLRWRDTPALVEGGCREDSPHPNKGQSWGPGAAGGVLGPGGGLSPVRGPAVCAARGRTVEGVGMPNGPSPSAGRCTRCLAVTRCPGVA